MMEESTNKKQRFDVETSQGSPVRLDPSWLQNGPAIQATKLGKKYRLYGDPKHRLKEAFHPFRKKYHREFWALKDVSFEIERGQSFGIIGKNGSGKSTVLKILANILQPTTGNVSVNGKVSALLELGAGFNAEYTGIENVYFNGFLMGYTKEEVDEKLDDILSFADIGEFISQPVKTYSSGMFIRLAFALVTSVDPDILIIDEALAVGDIFFKQKCYQRLERFREKGVTVVLVSHVMNDIQQFCSEVLLLHRGASIFHGNAAEAIKRFYLIQQGVLAASKINFSNKTTYAPSRSKIMGSNHSDPERFDFCPSDSAWFDISNAPQVSNGRATCTGVAICNSKGEACRTFQQGERAIFFYEFELNHDIEVPIGGLVIFNEKSIIVHGKSTLESGAIVPSFVPKGRRIRFRHEISLEVGMGEYTFEVGLATISSSDFGLRGSLTYHELEARVSRLCHLPGLGTIAVVWRRDFQPVQLLHHGLCNLPVDISVRVDA